MSTALQCETFVFDPRPRHELVSVVKRYWHSGCCSDAPDAVTLVFAHSTGSLNEHWEPTLEHLYDILVAQNLNKGDPGTVKIREAWCVEAPNHGESYVLNEEALSWGYLPVFAWEHYARSIHMFLAGHGTGVDVDFSTRRLVGVGHSMGAICLMLVDTYIPQVNFSCLILVDPMLLRKPLPGEQQIDLLPGAIKRRDVWPSREEALRLMLSRPPFSTWDPRIVRVFVEKGLRDLPTPYYLDKSGVTLKCPKEQEAACYRDALAHVRAYRYLDALCAKLPVHFIWGAVNDYTAQDIKDDVTEVAAKGRYASISTVEGAGHLVVQMQPERLANAIFAVFVHERRAQGAQRSQGTLYSRL